MSKIYTTEVIEVLENGDAILQFPPELIEEMGWKVDDTLNLTLENDCIIITKVDKKDKNE